MFLFLIYIIYYILVIYYYLYLFNIISYTLYYIGFHYFIHKHINLRNRIKDKIRIYIYLLK
jgi:hypothetical protein